MTTSKITGAIGTAAVLAAGSVLLHNLSDPAFLYNLYVAIKTHNVNDPQNTFVVLIAELIGLVGSFGLTILAAWLAKSPINLPSTPEESK